MPYIELKNICKHICRDVNLEILDRELLVLLGPSGAGKTTLLNVIAGLTDYEGSVLFDGMPMDKVTANKRKIGYLLQNLVLFPHLDVAANIAYSLKARRQPQSEVGARVEELLQMMKIQHLSSRYPKHLSGGEQQRVALARALAHSPQVLLLDEPLSSLDLQTARYLRTELRQLPKELGITTIYVTHDLDEAEEIADRIAVLDAGKIEQVGMPEEIFFYPGSEAVSNFIGKPNILDCDECRPIGQGIMEVNCRGLRVIVPHDGDSVHRIALFPRDIYVSSTEPPGVQVNRVKGTITDIKASRNMVRLRFKVGENIIRAEVPSHVFEEMDLAVGKEAFLILKLRKIRVHELNNRRGHEIRYRGERT